MSETNALLVELGESNVELWVDGGELRYRAPRGTMTAQLKARLAANKHAVISSLNDQCKLRLVDERDDQPFQLTELQHAYLLGYAKVADLGDLGAQIYLEFELPALDIERLRLTAAALIARHEALRAAVSKAGQQSILAHRSLVIEGSVLVGCSSEQVAARRLETRRALTAAVDPFDGSPFAVAVHETDGGSILFVCASLMVIDGTSLRILIEEGLQLYREPTLALPAARLSYRRYIAAIASVQSSPGYATALAYWRARLKDLPGAPELPLVSTSSSRSDRFTRRSKRISPAAWQSFKANCTEAGLTASAAVCAAYALTIAAFSRHPRFLLNVMHLNRPPLHPASMDVVGNFASTTLLDANVDLRMSFIDNARRVRRQLLADLEHSAVSGMTVVRELNLAEQASPRSRAPVVFASALDSPGARRTGWIDHLAFGALRTPHVWLDHQLLEDGGSVLLNWDVVEELFSPGFLDSAFAAYADLIDRLTWQPAAWHAPVRLTPSEHQQLIAKSNETERAVPRSTLTELVLASAERSPEALAVVGNDRRLSYRELVEHATAIAGWLHARGARRNGLVAIAMEKGWEQVVAVLGVGLSGAAYLPIDPSLPAERIRFLLAQCEPGLVLTQRRIESQVQWPDRFEHLCVDDALEVLPLPVGVGASPEDLAYVIFTSGSTGTPKGVMIAHRGAVNTVLDVNQRFAVAPRDRILALSSLSFDLSVYDIFGPLAAGGAIVMPAASASPDPAHWLELITRERVTLWNSVPALMQVLVEHAIVRNQCLGAQLRLVLLSGDWIPVRLPQAVRELAPSACVMSLGGATEASIWSIVHPTDGVPADAPSIPYGTAMANQRMYVFDEALEDRPLWVPGEIYIGGIGVAEGYFGDPTQTAHRFVVHPRTQERLYRTGDIGRWLPEGVIEFLGREDAQVKVQGFRIELGEIERALEGAPGVRAAVVMPIGERRGARALAAYVVADGDAPNLDPEQLRSFLFGLLPAYMVPARFAILERLPLTPNGKVDRSRLAGLEPAPRSEFVAPSSELECALAKIWCEVLGLERVGAQDDFFALGGDSLRAVRLAALVSARLQRELAISSLFTSPKLSAQAALLQGLTALPKNLVCLRSGVGTPLVLVHPIGGNVLCYRDLSRMLAESRVPIWGIQADEAAHTPSTLPSMAAEYVAALRQVLPQGPYRLGGWSLGGFLAVEMTRLLRDAGEQVDFTFVIDSRLPLRSEDAVERPQLLHRFLGDLRGQRSRALDALLAELHAAEDGSRLGVAHRFAVTAGILPVEVSCAAFERLFSVFERNAHALFAYQRPPLGACPVHSFSAEIDLAEHEELPDWDVVERIPGDHYSIMRSPSLERIAERLRSRFGSRPEVGL